MSGFIIDNTKKPADGCAYVHQQIRGFVEVQFERYLNGLQNPQPFKCECCGKEFTSPEDLDRSTT